jgi:hypothetical protein
LIRAGTIPAGANPGRPAAGDVNNDGALDAAVATDAGPVVLLNDGAGRVAP